MSQKRVMWFFVATCLTWPHTYSIAGVPTPIELLDLVADSPLMDQARALTDIVEARAEGVLSKTGPRIRFMSQAKRLRSMNSAETRNSDILNRIEVVRPLYDFGRRSKPLPSEFRPTRVLFFERQRLGAPFPMTQSSSSSAPAPPALFVISHFCVAFN